MHILEQLWDELNCQQRFIGLRIGRIGMCRRGNLGSILFIRGIVGSILVCRLRICRVDLISMPVGEEVGISFVSMCLIDW